MLIPFKNIERSTDDDSTLKVSQKKELFPFSLNLLFLSFQFCKSFDIRITLTIQSLVILPIGGSENP